MTRLSFLGAATTVTGSRYLLEHDGGRVLVDCGMFQGYKQLRQRNWKPLPVDPRSIGAVLLTHGHVDHSGWLPVLVRDGYPGRIHATAATCELTRLLLLDAGRLQEADAAFAARHRASRHDPPLPLYTEEDAEDAIARFSPCADELELSGGVRAHFTSAGHILGASTITTHLDGLAVTFSGDLGRADDPLMLPPAPRPTSDVVLVESTYGNRKHPAGDPADAIADVVVRTAARGGTIVIPAFAVGRTQTLLLLLDRLRRAGKIPELPIILDSPLGDGVTDLYERFATLHRLPADECARVFACAQVSTTTDDSKAIATMRGPKLIIAGSGMATGGRVVHHIARYGPSAQNTLLFTGFCAGGTRGADICGGAESVKIYGDMIPIRAEVVQLHGLSAHADADGLLAWLRSNPQAPRACFVVHGELDAAEALRHRIQDELGWDVRVPEHGETVELG